MSPPIRVGPSRRLRPRLIGLALATAAALLLRLPTATSNAVIGYDDGVYLASVLAMRDGGAPFRDVYSSQGPAFLPMLRLGDLLGFEGPWGARMVPVLAGAALVVIAYRLILRFDAGASAVLGAVLVASSGMLLFSTSRIESDGITAAFAASAVLAAAAPGRRRAIAAVVLVGLAIAVKSLFAAPAFLAVLWLLGRRHGAWRAVGAGVAVAGFVLLLSVPWGLVDVWEQSVRLHLQARQGNVDLLDRLSYLRRTLWQRDRLIAVVGGLGLATWLVRRSSHRPGKDAASGDLTIAVWIWFVGSLLLLLVHAPLFPQHFTVVVVPATVLAVRRRPPWIVLAAVMGLLVAGHGAGAGWRLHQRDASPAEREMVRQLVSIEPRDALIVTDEPTLAWLADRASPGGLVDPSHVRIDAGQLGMSQVAAGAHEPGVCAVLLWSGRLDDLPDLREALDGYRSVFREGDHELLLRKGCRLAG